MSPIDFPPFSAHGYSDEAAMPPLIGRRILVVGGGQAHSTDPSQPINNGRAICVTLARAGASLACADKSVEAARFTTRSVRAGGGSAVAIEADVARVTAIENMVQTARTALGGLDGLVLNVGISRREPLATLTADGWDEVMAVNLRAHMLTVQRTLPVMSVDGAIVFVSSVAARLPAGSNPAYEASKAALGALCRAAALAGQAGRVRANVVMLGLIDTPMGRAASAARPGRIAGLPLGRQGTPWEAAHAVRFLLSPESSYINAVELPVDGRSERWYLVRAVLTPDLQNKSAAPAEHTAHTTMETTHKSLGQSVVVENRAGAGGNIGAAAVANAPADGYTLLLGTIGTHGINPTLYSSLPYDPKKDFQPVALVSSGANVLVVTPGLPAHNVKELIALAKSKPDQLMMGSSGNGSSIHMSGELFKYLTGTKLTHVPYRGGSPALTDLMGGRLQLMFDNLPTSLPLIAKGLVRPLAVTSARRSPALPDVPTVAEAGVPGYFVSNWSGIFVPTHTPQDIVHRLNAAVGEAVMSPTLRKRYAEMGVDTGADVGSNKSAGSGPMGPAEFTKFVDEERNKWAKIVKASGAQPE
jgi:tripartite-type tricarboxylate transporter receptor subunit TctC/NAD(P)-dependent dehydrogenase (short-subunit alcohol dehydrogenase family)